ncbi:MAG: Raf kinase inhibitor-like YbhB/YbcL family protein [Cocleimonas sp.]|jgi:Raf kinase inhibitor-like YbhB/YbcL family protein
MKKLVSNLLLASSLVLSLPAVADTFTLSSTDIAQGQHMNKAQEFQGFGCEGGNKSPQLSWIGAPKGTEAFAVFAYDPDAPTGSGWWHWQLINIDKEVSSLPSGLESLSKDASLKGARHIKNDYGVEGFGGACPPHGHGVHRYQFTVYALSEKLELPEDASGALTGYMVKAKSLASTSIEALYKRD